MTKTLRSALLALPAAALVATAPGLAVSAVPSLPSAALVLPQAAAPGEPVLLARRGADDGPGHDATDDKGGQRKDKKKGKKKRGGKDDGPNHS